MKSMKLFSLFLLIFFWINANGQYIIARDGDPRFYDYKKCLVNIAEWKLLGPYFNGSFYEKFNFRFNKLIEKVYPIAIFTPKSTNDVQAAVKCGVQTNIQLVPISGGHCYAGLSAGTNDSIIVDFRYMNDISINHKKKVVSVESGTLLGDLYGELWKNGRLGAALGSCTTVAMGGLAIGGGIGYFSTNYGLVIDNLVEINMVDARGNILRVDETNHADLWWAMRGIGPGLIGFVTSVKLKVFDANSLDLTYVRVSFHNNCFKNVMVNFIKWLDWVKENDPNLNSVITVRSSQSHSFIADDRTRTNRPGTNEIELQILQVHDPKTTRNLDFINAALEIFREAFTFKITFPNFIEFFNEVSYTPVDDYNDDMSIDQKLDFYSSLTRESGKPHYHQARSFYVKDRYSGDNFKEAEKLILNMNGDCEILITSEQGAISQRQRNESAYVHRDALFNFKVFCETEDEEKMEQCRKWMDKFYESVEFLDSGETFQNYPGVHLEDYLERYYGTNLQRLIEIKKKWDPNYFFESKMSLPIDLP